MRRPHSPPPPPWLCCSAFNGTLYLILELAAMRFDGVSRWIFAAPISAAALGAVLWLFWGTSSATAAAHSSTHPGVWGALARTAYSILEQASLVAGVATLLEGEQRSWGAMVAVPFLVLLMIRLDDDPRRFAAARRSHIQDSQGGGSSSSSTGHHGDGMSNIVQYLLSHEVLFSATARALLAIAAGGLVFLNRGLEGHWPLRPHRPGAGTMDVLLFMVAVPLVLLLSTPVVGGPRPGGILHQWGWRGRWVRALQGVGTGIWYLLALLALRRVPSLVSWMGLPLLVTSSCLLVDSFREWTTNLRFAWAMAATLLGLSLAGEGMWWARFAVVACTGLFRAGMLAMGPLLWDRGVGEEQRRGGAEEGAASHLLLRLSPRAMQLQGR